MALQLSVAVRNARLDAVESTIGASAIARIYSAADAVLVEMALPADWMNPASGGTKTKLGSWSGVGTVAAGVGVDATYFQIFDSTGLVLGIKGTITITGGGGDMTLDNDNIAETQVVTVTQFTLTDGNALV